MRLCRSKRGRVEHAGEREQDRPGVNISDLLAIDERRQACASRNPRRWQVAGRRFSFRSRVRCAPFTMPPNGV